MLSKRVLPCSLVGSASAPQGSAGPVLVLGIREGQRSGAIEELPGRRLRVPGRSAFFRCHNKRLSKLDWRMMPETSDGFKRRVDARWAPSHLASRDSGGGCRGLPLRSEFE